MSSQLPRRAPPVGANWSRGSTDFTMAFPCCSLADRLRLVMNALDASSRQHLHTVVVWEQSAGCNSRYDDLFMPHPEFTVIEWHRGQHYFQPLCSAAPDCASWQSPFKTSGRQLPKQEQGLHAASDALFGGDDTVASTPCSTLRPDGTFAAVLATLGVPALHHHTPQIFGGCAPRIADLAFSSQRCSHLIHKVRPRTELQEMIARLLGPDRTRVVGVHLQTHNHRAASGRHVGRNVAKALIEPLDCHTMYFYGDAINEEFYENERLTTIYVASESAYEVSQFSGLLRARLHQHDRNQTRHESMARRGEPQILSLSDLRKMRSDARDARGQNTGYGMQGAVLDLWALASTYKVFTTGESTFGQLASALHQKPQEAVVYDTFNPVCVERAKRVMLRQVAANSTPSFCASQMPPPQPSRPSLDPL